MSSSGDSTIEAYESGAQQYIDHSKAPGPELRRFMDKLCAAMSGNHVLELGSGPGWDADYLELQGLRVTRTDATTAFVERLRAAGHDAEILDIRTDDLGGPYDAIWANAVLLHLDRDELSTLLHHARRVAGAIAFTLKEGDGDAWSTAKIDRPRHFTFWREDAVRELLQQTGWTAELVDHVEGRTEPWLHVLARATHEITFDVVSPVSETGRSILSRYMGDVAGSYWRRTASDHEIDQLMIDDPSEGLTLPTGVLIGAFIGGQIIGCIGLRLMGDTVGEMTRVYTVPECRGRGVGAQLVAKIEEFAIEQGLTQLRLDTRTDLTEARRLYARLGYEEVPAFNAGQYAQHWFAKKLSR